MKRFTILTIAPALTLFAVGCSPSAMQSTEYDDMYYSSADRTEYVQPAEDVYAKATEQPQQQAEAVNENGVPNPEYSENRNAVTDNYYGDEYYDGRTYDPRNNWYQPNYSFVDPYWGDNFVRNYGYSSYHRMRYADPFYDPFYYDPFFYDPFAYRPFYSRGVSVIVSFNYGWGGYYGRHYNPYYGRYYNPWYPSYYSPYHYHHGYYGRQYVYDYPRYGNTQKVQYGPRDARGGVVTDGGGQRGTRAERSNEQRSATPATQARPARTTERATRPATEESRETRRVITTRPGALEQYRSTRPEPAPERERTTREQPQQRPQYTPPAREYRQQQRPAPTQQQRPVQTRPSAPARETPRGTQRQEIRRSEPASSPAKSNSTETKSGSSGRPPRGQ